LASRCCCSGLPANTGSSATSIRLPGNRRAGFSAFWRTNPDFLIFPYLSRMSTPSVIDDRELLLQVAEGSERAFDTLYHRHSKKVYTFALRILQSEVLAEEVMQETLLKVWRLGGETANIDNLDGYLRTAARNASLNLLRRQEIERRAAATLA